MQQGIKKLQWCEYLKLVFLEILNPLLCRVFANQVTYVTIKFYFMLIVSYSLGGNTYVHMHTVPTSHTETISRKQSAL